VSNTIPNNVMESFVSERNAAAQALGERTLPNNPNQTYSGIIGPTELRFLATLEPNILNSAENILTDEEVNAIKNRAYDIIEKRVKPYNRPPVNYDLQDRFPAYYNALQRADEYREQERIKIEGMTLEERNIYDTMTSGTTPDVLIAEQSSKPIGVDKSIEIAKYGFDPDNYIDYNMDASQALAFRSRNMSKEEWEKWGNQYGIKGEFRYVNPSRPDLGVAVKQEGEDEYKLLNSPRLTAQDIHSMIVQEFPSVAGDIALTYYGTKKFEPFFSGQKSGILRKGGQILGMSGLSSLGAAGGDFIRLAYGRGKGYNDYDMVEAMEEAGVVGAMTMGTTTAMTTAMKLFPKIWRFLSGKAVPDNFFQQIRTIRNAKDRSKTGERLAEDYIYGTEISLKEIDDAIDEITDLMKQDFMGPVGGGYNPTLAAATGMPDAVDLELAFVKYADNPEILEKYQKIVMGNRQVMERFVEALNMKIGPSIAGKQTGATLQKELQILAQKEVDAFKDQAFEMLENVKNNIRGGDDLAEVGTTLLKDVPDERISTPLFQRTMANLNGIKERFVKPYTEAFEQTINDPKYGDLITGAGYTREPASAWSRARKGETDKLFKVFDGDEATEMLYGIVRDNDVLKRLKGFNPKTGRRAGAKDIGFTLPELNDARIVLNDFASNTSNKEALKLARNLERGLENQMFKLLEDGAVVEMKKLGLPTGKKAVREWMSETKFGYEIADAWSAQTNAIRLSNSQAVKDILQMKAKPEAVADYILATSTPGATINTKVSDLMKVLNETGADEVLQMQKGLAEYVRKNVLTKKGSETAMDIANNFRKFMGEHQATLEAVFGKDGFKNTFKYNPRAFEREVIDKIAEKNNRINMIQARFGLTIDPDKSFGNIVESLLSVGTTSKQSGRVIEDAKYILDMISDQPDLQKQVAQVTKRYIRDNILKPKKGSGGLFEIDAESLNRFINEGFGPTGDDIIGSPLTFENFIAPLLGDDGLKYVKNLRILNEMAQREIGPESVIGTLRASRAEQVEDASPIAGSTMLQRMMIAPLTQLGRRITALTNRVNDRSRKALGNMLLDDELFDRAMAYQEGRLSITGFMRFLQAHDTVASRDMYNELQYYNTEDKIQEKRQPIKAIRDAVIDPFTILDKSRNALQGVRN
jgi:hypothetical protein